MPWFLIILQLGTLAVLYSIVKEAGMPQLAWAIVISDLFFLLGAITGIPLVAPLSLVTHFGLLAVAGYLMRKHKVGPWKEQ